MPRHNGQSSRSKRIRPADSVHDRYAEKAKRRARIEQSKRHPRRDISKSI